MVKKTTYFVCYRFSTKSIWYFYDTCHGEKLLETIKSALSINGVSDVRIYTNTKEREKDV